MITCFFASQPNQFDPSPFSATVSSGGSTTITTNHYYWIQGLSRGGFNLQTALGRKAVNIGEKLTISLISALPNGSNTFGVVVSASEDNNPENARILGIMWVKDKDQETNRNLPVSLVLSKDIHFAINENVSLYTDLSSLNKVNGMIRYVTKLSRFYLYDAEGWLPQSQNTIGWTQVNGNQCYLTSTKTPRPSLYLFGGCDCPISSLVENSSLDIPYGWESGTETLPIKVWMLNENNPVSGGKLTFNPTVDGDPILGQSLLDQVTTITPTNQIDYTTGVIDNALTNVPLVYSKGQPFYTLESVLGVNKVLEFEIVTSAVIGNGQSIDFNIIYSGNTGTLIINPVFGSGIFAESTNPKFLRALPTLIEVGTGIVQIPNSVSAYYFKSLTTQLYNGLVANTADQIVAVNAQQNGGCRVIQNVSNLLDTEAIRAVISTEGGVQSASEWSNPISISTDAQIILSFNHPTAIRTNYPDSIAGMDAVFSIDGYIIELELDGTSYFFDSFSPVGSPEAITLSSVSGVPSTPPTIKNDTKFGLFSLGNLTISEEVGQGTLPAKTTVRVRIFQKYVDTSTTISKISHSPSDGCIPENNKTFAEVSILGDYYGTPIATKADLKAISVTGLKEGLFAGVLENHSPYIFVTNLPQADDGENYLESNDGTTQGWVKAGGQGSGGSVSDGDKGDIAVSDNGETWTINNGAITTDKVANNAITTDKVADRNITFPKMVAISTARILGRLTAGSGDIEELTGTQLTTLVNLFTTGVSGLKGLIPSPLENFARKLLIGSGWLEIASKGSIVVSNGTSLTELPVGINGYKLKADSGTSTGLNWVEDTTGQAYTTTTASFTQPAINGTVNVEVGNTSNFLAGLSYIAMQTGGNYLVTAINTTSNFTLQYLGGGVSPTSIVTAGKKVTPTGSSGSDGKNAQTTTTANFTVPAIAATVNVSVVDSGIFNTNTYINIDGAGDYQVTVIVDETHITVKNLGGDNNAAPSSNIPSGSQIIIIGSRGATGSVSATTSLIFVDAISSPISTAGEWKLFIDLDNSNRFTLSNDNNEDVIAFLSDIPVASVNSQTGVVVLDADDIDDSATTNKFATQSELAAIASNSSAISNKQDTLVSGTNIKTINSESLLGSGNIVISGGGGREVLTANRTYYVRTDGSDSNDGLTNTSDGAFLTIKKARDVLRTLDGNGYSVTIKIADGTYLIDREILFSQFVGISKIIIEGNTTNISNVVLQGTIGMQINESLLSFKNIDAELKGCKLTNTVIYNSSFGIIAYTGASIVLYNNNWGAFGNAAIWAVGGLIEQYSNFTISGGGNQFWVISSGEITVNNPLGSTVTVLNNPYFDQRFIAIASFGRLNYIPFKFSWSGSGSSPLIYYVEKLGILNMYGQPINIPINGGTIVQTGGYVI